MIERREKDDKEKTEQFNKLFTKTTKEKNRDPHYNYCKLKGTSRPWGIDEECTCPDAYILRK